MGEWVDGIEAADRSPTDIHASESRVGPAYADHEELWVMDHEGFMGALSGECSPSEAQRIAELLDGFAHQAGAFAAYLDHTGDLDYAVESFEEAYAGEWDSEREYAEELADDIYGLGRRGADDPLVRYFDAEAFARDLFMGDYFSAPSPAGPGGPGGVYVFRSL